MAGDARQATVASPTWIVGSHVVYVRAPNSSHDERHGRAISQWTTRQRADEVLRDYANHPNARHADELVRRPRTRFVGHAAPSAA